MKKLIVLFAILSLASCQKDIYEDLSSPEALQVENMTDLVIDNHFDWKTTRGIQLTLRSHSNYPVSVKDDKGNILAKVFVKGGGEVVIPLEVPSTCSTLHVSFGDGTRTQPINSSSLTVHNYN
jgi:hypothetical protein